MSREFPDFPSLNTKAEAPSADEIYIPEYVPVVKEALNLETELLEQLNSAKRLRHTASFSTDIPLNQQASLLNAITSIIGNIVKMQADLHSLENVKRIENTLLKVLREFPDLQEAFMEAYAASLETAA